MNAVEPKKKIKLDIINPEGEKVGEFEIDDIFSSPSPATLWYYVKWYLSSHRAGTADTKTISDVRGGGRKPWQQKHTGRARQGSIRNPHWVGGAVAHGPHPRDFSYKLNKKQKIEALRTAIALKHREGKLKIISSIDFKEPKTKRALETIRKIEAYPLILVTNKSNKNVYLSFRNIPLTRVIPKDEVNAYEISKYEYSVFEKEAFINILERIKKVKSKEDVERDEKH